MLSNKAALAAVGVAALAASAAAGAFLATTRGAADAPASTAVMGTSGVEATEAVVEDAAPPAEVAPQARAPLVVPPAPAARPAPAAAAPRRSSPPPPRDRERPSVTASRPAAGPSAEPARAEAPPPVEPSVVESTRPIEESRVAERLPEPPPMPRYEELVVPSEAVIGLELRSGLSSDTAHVEDRVEARVSRDVRADGRVAIPAGSRVLGSVTLVERGGKMKERARLGVRFHTVILADGTELPLSTDTVYREGESPANASAAKVGGGAIGGAILGAILGGGKGAAIGAGVGAGAGTAAVMAGGRKPAQIQAGAPVTVKVLSPVTVTVER